ncbi:SIR2 family protein [Bacillus sp. 1P10SD]|uniref:SIR2 family protein n=1 Tax=Bacillus sp. 1P10SD TaxID=3132265 RepID=UPI0039A6E3AA
MKAVMYVSFLVGAGASIKAINGLGNFEIEITEIIRDYQAEPSREKLNRISEKLNEFIRKSVTPNKILFQKNLSKFEKTRETLGEYKQFLKLIYNLILLRASDKLPKKINIFTTNYDLFFKTALEELRLNYNDGGNGNLKRYFESKNFQKRITLMSDSYSYEYESPIFNIVKIHGSVNWFLDRENIIITNNLSIPIINNSDINSNGFLKENTNVPIILPTKQKFVRTLMEHIYYDLSRFFANELERKNSILICFGFSFADEHIRSMTLRALGNPSLTIYCFPFSYADEQSILQYFDGHENFKVVRIHNSSTISHEGNFVYANKTLTAEGRINCDFKNFINIFEHIYIQVAGGE